MSSAVERIYWDACAWIAFFNKERGKVAALRSIWEDASRGRYQILTSVYNYLEVIHGVNEIGAPYPPEEYDEIVFSHFNQPHVERVVFDVEVAKLARALKRQHHPTLGKRPDAIHLATAAFWNCSCLHTYDGSDLLPLHNKVQRRDGQLLAIRWPGAEPVGPLFLAGQGTSSLKAELQIVKGDDNAEGDG